MNVRKIPMTLEVAFWNVVISTLTVVKEMRSYSQSSPAAFPVLKKSESPNSPKAKINPLTSILGRDSGEVRNIFINLCFSAVLGFIIGFILGILIVT